MPAITHSLDLNFPIETLWKFVHSVDHWAPIIPGYISHTVINKRTFEIQLKVKFGVVNKTVKLIVTFNKYKKPNITTFSFSSDSNSIEGTGSYIARAVNPRQTKVTVKLDVTANGAMGQMINVFLNNFKPEKKLTLEIQQAIAKKIREVG